MARKKPADHYPEYGKDADLPDALEHVQAELASLTQYKDPDDDWEANRDDIHLRQKLAIECYIATLGHVVAASKLCKIAPRTFYRWLDKEEFQRALHKRMLQWELMLNNKALTLAKQGDKTMLMFMLKFLNPYYDDNFRARLVAQVVGENTFERHPIPTPEFLPPEIPERFGTPGDNDTNGDAEAK